MAHRGHVDLKLALDGFAMKNSTRWWGLVAAAWAGAAGSGRTETWVQLEGVPDYEWYAGCFGTACGNLAGYWDRHGFPDFYTGPTADGVAPLDSFGVHEGIRSLWATQAGLDERPLDRPGHIDDYWEYYRSDFDFSYESTLADAYVRLGRQEHVPDCLGDFTGLSQKKWKNMADECDGNIDAYSFVYWDPSGAKRWNYAPDAAAGAPARDLQSGLREWTHWRGYQADVFTQWMDFNPQTPGGRGFTFEEMKAEIDAGYPVLLFLQQFGVTSRSLPGMAKANPEIHGMLAFGYYLTEDGSRYVNYRTSWASGSERVSAWTADAWEANLPVRGVIGYHPKPRIRSVVPTDGVVRISWDGPSSILYDRIHGTRRELHYYVVELSPTLQPEDFRAISPPSQERSVVIPNCCPRTMFFRVRLVPAQLHSPPLAPPEP
jgi:hypothetical protein